MNGGERVPPAAQASPPLERVPCPRCGRLLFLRAPNLVGRVQIKCRRCSWREGVDVLIDLQFVIEIRVESGVDCR